MKPRKLRVIIDEQLSAQVAKALIALDKTVTRVGFDDAPKRGSKDAAVVDFALQKRLVIVSKNFDLIVLAAASRCPVIWVDNRRRQATLLRQVVHFFSQWPEWERELAKSEVDCLKVTKSSVEPMTFDECRRRALARFKRAQRRERARAARRAAESEQGHLFEDDEPE